MAEKSGQQIYLVVSQTGTILSRILKIITGAEYNHVSLSLDPKLRRMYSFGRRHPYNPFWAGFVRESPRAGTFKRFYKTDAVVLSINVDEETYQGLKALLEGMYERRSEYHYNSIGLVLAAFGFHFRPRNCYYCSEFVSDLLTKFNIVDDGTFGEIVKPIHFLNLNSASEIYRGRLRTYRA